MYQQHHASWFLYARSNAHASGGYRQLQMTTSNSILGPWSDLRRVHLCHVPDSANIYYAQVYGVGDMFVLIAAITFPAGSCESGTSGTGHCLAEPWGSPGIYVSWSVDGVYFLRPVLLFPSREHACRTYDMPVGGAFLNPSGIFLPILRDSARRMQGRHANHAAPRLELWSFKIFPTCPWRHHLARPTPPVGPPTEGADAAALIPAVLAVVEVLII